MHIPSFLLAPKPKNPHSYQESKPLTPFIYLIRNSAFSTLTFSERSNSQKERQPQAIGVNGRILLHCLIFSLYSFVGKKSLMITRPPHSDGTLSTHLPLPPLLHLYKPHAKKRAIRHTAKGSWPVGISLHPFLRGWNIHLHRLRLTGRIGYGITILGKSYDRVFWLRIHISGLRGLYGWVMDNSFS